LGQLAPAHERLGDKTQQNGNENSADDNENSSNRNQISTGTSATEMKITARQKNSAFVIRGRANRSSAKQATPLLARERVGFAKLPPLRVRGTGENG
jgi:hypothetical protein